MKCLEKSGLVETVKAVAKSGKPLLGICLGLHLMFEESDETPGVKGLGIFKGKIVKIPEKDGLKIPHMGHLIANHSDGHVSCSYFKQHIRRPQAPEILVGLSESPCSFAIFIDTGTNSDK